MPHREGIREFLKDVQVYGVVHDWGCGTKPIKNYLEQNNARFIGIDKLDHVGADIIANVGEPLNLGQLANFAFCLEVIEHVWNSRQLLQNIHAHLKEGGILYLSQPFMYEVHKHDDVHRYTHHGLKRLLEEEHFIVDEIKSTGGTMNEALGYVLKARKV